MNTKKYSMTIALPEKLQESIRLNSAELKFKSVSAYVQACILAGMAVVGPATQMVIPAVPKTNVVTAPVQQ